MSAKKIHAIESSIVKDGIGLTKKVLISLEEAPNFAMRCFTIQPGGHMPNHTAIGIILGSLFVFILPGIFRVYK